MKNKHSTRPMILIGLVTFGLVLLFLSWTGLQQLSILRNPSSTTATLNDVPVVKPVWEFFAPDQGKVVVASVASKVQMTFGLMGLLGLILIVASAYLMAISLRRLGNNKGSARD